MAESFVSGVAQNLLGKIASLVLQEASLAWGLKRDLKKLEESLTTVKAVLLDAEDKQAQSHALRLWLEKLKKFCYDAEDVLGELEYQTLRKHVERLYGNTTMKVSRLVSSSNSLIFLPMMAHKVKELRERLDEIAAEKSKFHLTELGDYRLVGRIKREMTDSLLRTSNVVGRESDKEILVKFLLDPIVGGDISVIPIVGLGGLGKTTLAKMLYNDQSVDEYFDRKIWVCVSEIFEKKQIMVNMLKSLTLQNRGDLDPDQLQKLIQEKLDSKKFLLVLDDVWSDDRGKWIDFMDLLKGGAAGSKVIVTTRNVSVATTVRTVPSYDLKGLSYEKCLSLFNKLAFREGEKDFHPHLQKIGGGIVKKCGGLPLAVKTLGTLLYSKTDESYWKFIRDNELWKLQQNENDILPALTLSYDQMSSHLKSCFDVLSIYPKDTEFNDVQLAHIWMAHGLVQSSNNDDQDMEDVGLQYVKELYSRSFLQDFQEFFGVFIFKMHDLVHDLALSVAQSECFVINTHSKNISDGIRHLSLSDKVLLEQDVPHFLRKENSLRTICFPSEMQGPACESFVNTCISSCTYLRMLDLSESFFEVLPSSIGDLKHLRYLGLTSNRRLTRLPDSIWKLHNLETLLLGNCSELEELPRGIRNLMKLRLLVITVKHLPEDEIGYLTSLRVLIIDSCTNHEFLTEGMQRLTSLRRLDIWNCNSLISLPRNLKYLTRLEVLIIINCHKLNMTEEDENQDIKVSLQFMTLGSLPRLVTLPKWLKKSFNTLQSLTVRNCANFSSFPEWFQDFPSLKKIEIKNCPKLLSLPEGMHRLTALKELKIGGCPTLRKRCQKLVGEDWHKIAHVSNIGIYDEDEDD